MSHINRKVKSIYTHSVTETQCYYYGIADLAQRFAANMRQIHYVTCLTSLPGLFALAIHCKRQFVDQFCVFERRVLAYHALATLATS